MLDQYVVVYLDDILIYSPSIASHVTHVSNVLQRLRDNRLYAKLEKCMFHVTEVEFLGYNITNQGVQMSRSKVSAILDWPRPNTLKALQSFLGFANFYRRFIQDYSALLSPLTALTSTKHPFKWNAQAQIAFEALKSTFTSAPVL
ncbi:uncharacterized protein [Ambystoma mexicanum]|uniref:uncharacterized protein n=1 Tax=Ambystoma mexicanum TaxID=8296 RepID=UPI0037E70301